MNTRRKILRFILDFCLDKGPDNYVYADTLPEFQPHDQRYLSALNQLLREALILGLEGEDVPAGDHQGRRVAVAINPAKLDEVRDALHRIDNWSQAYPLSVFPKPDLKKAAKVLKENGMTLDAISADAMRHVVEGVGKIARAALRGEGES